MPILNSRLEQLDDRSAILHLEGEVDMSNADTLVAHFKTVVDHGLTRVIIDATGVSFMDSTGVHSLVAGKRLLHETGCEIALVPSPPVRRLLELAFSGPLFAARVDTVEEALSFFDGGGTSG